MHRLTPHPAGSCSERADVSNPSASWLEGFSGRAGAVSGLNFTLLNTGNARRHRIEPYSSVSSQNVEIDAAVRRLIPGGIRGLQHQPVTAGRQILDGYLQSQRHNRITG